LVFVNQQVVLAYLKCISDVMAAVNRSSRDALGIGGASAQIQRIINRSTQSLIPRQALQPKFIENQSLQTILMDRLTQNARETRASTSLPSKKARGICYDFKKSGWCTYGAGCRYVHSSNASKDAKHVRASKKVKPAKDAAGFTEVSKKRTRKKRARW
jgi:hypothetical protein